MTDGVYDDQWWASQCWGIFVWCNFTFELPLHEVLFVCFCHQGNAKVDCCTFNGSTPLHIAAGRGSVKLTALLMAAGRFLLKLRVLLFTRSSFTSIHLRPHRFLRLPFWRGRSLWDVLISCLISSYLGLFRCRPTEGELWATVLQGGGWGGELWKGERGGGRWRLHPRDNSLQHGCHPSGTRSFWASGGPHDTKQVNEPAGVCLQVWDLLNGKEYKPKTPQTAFVPPQGELLPTRGHFITLWLTTVLDVVHCFITTKYKIMTSAHRFADDMFACVGDLASLDTEVKQALCGTLESEGCWENLAHSLGLGILNTAFRLSPSPAKTLLDSYEVTHTHKTRSHTLRHTLQHLNVLRNLRNAPSRILWINCFPSLLQVSGGTIRELLAALRSVGECRALSVLEEALHESEEAPATSAMSGEHAHITCT